MTVGNGGHEGYGKGMHDYCKMRPENAMTWGEIARLNVPGETENSFMPDIFDLIRDLSRLTSMGSPEP